MNPRRAFGNRAALTSSALSALPSAPSWTRTNATTKTRRTSKDTKKTTVFFVILRDSSWPSRLRGPGVVPAGVRSDGVPGVRRGAKAHAKQS